MTKYKNDEYWKTGQNYMLITVTRIITGRLIHVGKKELVLDQAAWIADTGRFAACLSEGLHSLSASEIEPYGDVEVIVPRTSLISSCIYNHKLPTEVK
jgi:hypothetical protein